MKSKIYKPVSLLMLVTLTACSTMQPVTQPREFMAARQPSVVWLAKSSEPNMFVLEAPKLVGDSIVGFIEGEYTEIALNQIKAMQAKQYSRSRTTLFVVGAAALVGGLFLVVKSGGGANYDMDGEDDIGIIRFRR
jgi:hypothetical protein